MINEIDKKIMEFEVVSADDWIGDNSEEICLNKVRKVFGRLTNHWLPILISRNLPLPENEYGLAELIFSQPDYQSRAQRDAKTPEQLLKEAKETKIKELEVAYTNAQLIKVVNRHTFYIPLKGEFYNTHITQKLTVAQSRGYATLVAQDTNGAGITIEDVPYSFWKKFIEIADPISISNFNLKNSYLAQIKVANQEELDAITISFPTIKEVLMDLPDVNDPLQIAKNKKKIEISAYKDYRLSLPTPQTIVYQGTLSNRNFKMKEGALSFFATQIVYLKDQIELGVENPTRPYTDSDNVELQLTLDDFRSLFNHANERDAQEQNQCNKRKDAVDALTTIEEVEAFDITQIIL